MGFKWRKLFARHLATGSLSRAWDFARIAEEQLSLPQDGDDDRLPLACKALSCVQTCDTKSKLGKAENRCLSVLTDDRGGLKRTTQRDDLGMPPPSQHDNYRTTLHRQQWNGTETPAADCFPECVAQITRSCDRKLIARP